MRHRINYQDDTGGIAAYWIISFGMVSLAFLTLLTGSGQAISEKQRANGIARDAARAGVNAIDPEDYRQGRNTSPATLTKAVQDFCALPPAKHYTCKTVVNGEEVQVTVTRTITAKLLGSVTVKATATARPALGVTRERP